MAPPWASSPLMEKPSPTFAALGALKKPAPPWRTTSKHRKCSASLNKVISTTPSLSTLTWQVSSPLSPDLNGHKTASTSPTSAISSTSYSPLLSPMEVMSVLLIHATSLLTSSFTPLLDSQQQALNSSRKPAQLLRRKPLTTGYNSSTAAFSLQLSPHAQTPVIQA